MCAPIKFEEDQYSKTDMNGDLQQRHTLNDKNE